MRIGEQLVGGRILDDAAEVHDGHLAGDVAHDGQIVGDEEVGEPEPLLQLLQQVDHLALDRHVERGDRLVADDDARVDGQRPGDADALALAARELVGIAQRHVGEEPDHLQQLGDAIGDLRLGQDAVHADRLGDDLADRHARIERGIGVLEDHLHLLAHGDHLLAVERREVHALEADLARGRVVEAQHQAAEGGFSAAGLADQPQRLAALDGDRDVVDGAHQLVPAQEAHADRGSISWRP